MTEEPTLLLPDGTPATVADPAKPRRNSAPWLVGLGFLVLAAAVFYLYRYPRLPPEAATMGMVEQRLADLDGRLNRLEQRPVVNPGQLTSRIDGLDSKLADQAKLATRMDGLDARLADQAKIVARMDSIDAKFADQAQIASRLDTLSGRIEALSARDQTAIDANKAQLDSLGGRVATQEANAGTLSRVAGRLDRLTKLREATSAFAAGRPIGELPGAPDAVARYAHVPPPTEAQLRLRFPQAEQAALAARQSDTNDAPLIDRAWERAQGLMTIRQGNEVVVGNSSSTTLSQARTALEAGDVAGAVKAVETLTGQPGKAMANWLADAKSFLAARAALADMADHV
jgi:hypothetical protein